MKFRTKIWSLVGFFILLLLAFAGTTIFNAAKISEGVESFADGYLPVESAANDVRIASLEQAVIMERAIALQAEEDRSAARGIETDFVQLDERIDRRFSEIDQQLEVLRDSAAEPEEVDLLRRQEQELHQAYRRFAESARQYIRDIQGETEIEIAAAVALNEESDLIGRNLRDFAATVEEMAGTQVEAMREIALALGGFLLTLTVIGIAGGLLVAGFLVRALLRQLGGEPEEVTAIAGRVAQGDLTVSADEEGKKKEKKRGLLAAMM
ncbi:MAG TPA: hypothetical protein ENN41_02020 [Sediminispirochaeta sp.]|nr:hypothetical protein [Sediminispirochaeta sp.]